MGLGETRDLGMLCVGDDTRQSNRTIATISAGRVLRRAIGPTSLCLTLLVLTAGSRWIDHLTSPLIGPLPPLLEAIHVLVVGCLVVMLVLIQLVCVVLPLLCRTLNIEAGAIAPWPLRVLGGTRIPLRCIAEVRIRKYGTLSNLGMDRGVTLILNLPTSRGVCGWCHDSLRRLTFMLNRYHVLIPQVFFESPQQIAMAIASAAEALRQEDVPVLVVEKSGRRYRLRDGAPDGIDPTLEPGTVPKVAEGVVCVGCGYDLRGQTTAGVCSECGSRISESTQAHLLRFAPSVWVRSLRRGAFMLAFGGIGYVVTALTLLPSVVIIRTGGRPPIGLALGALLSLPSSCILLTVGALFVTRREYM